MGTLKSQFLTAVRTPFDVFMLVSDRNSRSWYSSPEPAHLVLSGFRYSSACLIATIHSEICK